MGTRHQSPALGSPPQPRAGAAQGHHERTRVPPCPLLSAAASHWPCPAFPVQDGGHWPGAALLPALHSSPRPESLCWLSVTVALSGRARAPPPRPVTLSPLKLPLLLPRSGPQAWPLRTPSQASGHRPRGPLPSPSQPGLASPTAGVARLTPGAQRVPLGSLAWGPHVPRSAFPSPP